MSPPRKTYCPHCQGEFSINKDGTLRTHGYRVSRYSASGRACPGSGQRVTCPCVFRTKASALKGEPDDVNPQCLTHGLGSPF